METNKKQELFSEIAKSITDNKKYSVTFTHLEEFTYTWKVINFGHTMEKYVSPLIESPWFKIGDDQMESRICLNLNDAKYLKMFFEHKKLAEQPVRFVISIVDKDNKEKLTQSILNERSMQYIPNLLKFVQKSFLLDEKNGLLPDGNLIISCTIYFNRKIIHVDDLYSISDTNALDHRFEKSEYFEKLFKYKKFSDSRLIVDNKVFYVHKIILAMSSPVFSAMFDNKVKKEKENSIVITDVNHSVMKEVLRFIYTGKINDFVTLGKDILAAADKYEIDDLKYFCEKELISTLSSENVEEILILADRFNADNLKKYLLEFLNLTAKDVMKKKLCNKIIDSISESSISEMLKAL